jgi:hypothetical protein
MKPAVCHERPFGFSGYATNGRGRWPKPSENFLENWDTETRVGARADLQYYPHGRSVGARKKKVAGFPLPAWF